MSGLFLTSMTLIWILPAPAFVATYFSALIYLSIKIRAVKRYPISLNLNILCLGVVIGICLIALAIEAYVYLNFGQRTTGQITEGSIDGMFPLSRLLTLGSFLILAIGIAFSRNWSKLLLALFIVIPISILATAIAVYQLSDNGQLSYYFVKTLALSFLAIGMFLPMCLTSIVDRWSVSKLNHLSAAIIVIIAFTGLFVLTKQPFDHSIRVIAKYSNIDSRVSGFITSKYLINSKIKTDYPVLLTGDQAQDKNGFLYLRVYNQRYSCSKYIIPRADYSIETSLRRIKSCSKDLSAHDKTLTVLTTSRLAKKINLDTSSGSRIITID